MFEGKSYIIFLLYYHLFQIVLNYFKYCILSAFMYYRIDLKSKLEFSTCARIYRVAQKECNDFDR